MSYDNQYSSPLSDNYDELEPIFEGYQLIGDSQLLRFSEQLLGLPRRKKYGIAYLGLCVSGQRTCDLLKRVREDFHPVSDKVVLMIGTNDLMKNTNITMLKKQFTDLLVELLQRGVDKMIVLTVPPVPRLARSENHWNLIKDLNRHILDANNGKDIVVIDIYQKFMKSSNMSNSIASFRSSLVSNSSNSSSPVPSGSLSSLNFPFTPNTSSSKIKTNLRIQIGSERTIYKTGPDEDEDAQDPGYASAQHTPSRKRRSDLNSLTPLPKRKFYGSSVSVGDDDHEDRFDDDDWSGDESDLIRTEYFEQYFNGQAREDKIHLNNKGLRLIKRLILDEIRV